MMIAELPQGGVETRAVDALLNVLPPSARTGAVQDSKRHGVILNGESLDLKWIGEGRLADVAALLSRKGRRPDVVVARHLSPGAREKLSEAQIGWVDETGAAEIATASILISRSGRKPKRQERTGSWTRSTLAVTEAVLSGTPATVSAVVFATELSTGSCANALRFLGESGFLKADANRGRSSARRLGEPGRLLDAYAAAVEARPNSVSLQVGVVWQDHLAGLAGQGQKWADAGVSWAATGLAAASVLAPYITLVSSSDVYVDARTVSGLEALALDSGLRPIEGGRLTLRPFPTRTAQLLARDIDGLRVVPWPRVFADLRGIGVRGEEAADHLREVVLADGT